MKAWIVFVLITVVFLSGCTNILQFGQDVISVNVETSVEGERNVLVVNDKLTIPRSPVLTDQSVQFSFVLENKDAEKRANNFKVDLFDAPLMKSTDGRLCNQPGFSACKAEGLTSNVILPGEQRQITFDLFSPSQGQIGGLKTDLKLNFLVKYDFEGSTTFTVPVVNVDEIKARQRAGDKIKVDVIKSIGSGPMQVDPELFGAQYILGGQSGTFFFVVKNKGIGNLEFSRIRPEGLCIYFPKEFLADDTVLVDPDGDQHKGPGASKVTGAVTGNVVGGYIDTAATANPITGGAVATSSGGISSGTGTCICLVTAQGSLEGKCTSECGSFAEQTCNIQDPNACTAAAQTSTSSTAKELFVCISSDQASDVNCHDTNNNELKNKILCYNVDDVELFRDESRVSMRFSIHKIRPIAEPFRSMTVLTRIEYTYEIRDSFDITVIPAKE
jgi:hypothetical protein